MADVKFQVGQRYSNRDGTYEVLAVDSKAGRMDVRFEGGETRSLDMAIQSRIVQNLELEGRMAARAEQVKAAPPRPRGTKKAALGREFTGMRPEDFLDTVTGTTWRSRASLAGGVAELLQQHFRMPFKSKAPRTWARVFLSHQVDELSAKELAPHIAKFTLWADPEGFHYGLYLERRDEQYRDWERFAKSLAEKDDLRTLVARMEEEGLRVQVFLHRNGVPEPLLAEGASWEDRLDALSTRHDGEYRDLYLSFSLPVDDAIARGRGLMDDVAEALVKLAPLYTAATP